jgi:S-ribosylhomocysteine lyase LuxS involved in autoinducer biosynthesis
MNQEISDLFSQYDIGKTTQANFLKEIFAVRDKWWIEKMEDMRKNCSRLPECEKAECGWYIQSKNCEAWQSLKQSLEAK